MFRVASARFLRPALAATVTATATAGGIVYATRPAPPTDSCATREPVWWRPWTTWALALAESPLATAPPHWIPEARKAGTRQPALPNISAADVRKSNGKGGDGKILVGFGDGVYDVTEFASVHPGGNYIMLAAGGPLEPHWRMYGQHNVEFVREILEEMRVGNLVVDEQWVKQMEGTGVEEANGIPYANEPQRSAGLIVQSEAPFNAEPDMRELVKSQITPTELFYVRNHMPVPLIKAEEYELEIAGINGETMAKLSLGELQTKFPKHEVAATVQCAGNRRNELDAHKKVKGGRWEAGAISNATWAGARLSDVLDYAQAQRGTSKSWSEADHLCLEGLDADVNTGTAYGASVPMDIVRRVPDVLLAYEMNGETLPRDHGYPVRAVVPGVVGARCVKWVGKVKLSEQESTSHWQKQDYRCFGPHIDWDSVDFDASPSIQEMPVISAICDHKIDLKNKSVSVSGYAWSGDGKAIIRVDVSADGGKTWSDAKLRDKGHGRRNETYDWTLWDAKINVEDPDKVHLVCKAIDSCHNTQPENVDGIWNLRGLLNNSWHRVEIN